MATDDASPSPPTPPEDAVPVAEDSGESDSEFGSDSEPETESDTSPLDRLRLVDSPILLLVYFHKAFRAEIVGLRRAVSHATERGRHAPDFVLGLLRRFEFLKLACKYHCAAEDEVIFMALDAHVKNVTPTYSLEHKSIDRLFDSIFFRLNAILEESCIDKNTPQAKPFQELVLCLGTIQTLISKHMLKEEKQIFPKLVEHISVKEQASLVWQFMSSVPIVLLEDMFPWMLSFLSPQEQQEVKNCLIQIVPQEKLLQEVVLSWLGSSSSSRSSNSEPSSGIGGVSDMKALLKSRRYFGQSWSSSSSSLSTHDHDLVNSLGQNPLDCLRLWHGAIKKDLITVLGELYKAKSSSDFSNLDNNVIQLKFLADIITFYSNALEKLFSPVLNQLVHGYMSPSTGGFPSDNHIEGLQMLLYHTAQNVTLPKFVNKLCRELESFIGEITKQFSFHEKEVFPIIGKNCNHSIQQQILYVSVHMMPLGLLKCVIMWLSSHLSKKECKSVLRWIKPEDPSVDESFASLLHDWIRTGCSGKISAEKFGTNLQQTFRSRRSFLFDQIKSESTIPDKGKRSSSGFGHAPKKYEASYSSVINLHIYFPDAMKSTYHPFSITGEGCPTGSSLHDPKPMDLIFYFHKALKVDLEYLVSGSLHLAENRPFLGEFRMRFNLIKFLYQIHSDAEDEVAFPALEAKGKVANISHSYTMDHELESEHFRRVLHILDKLSNHAVSLRRHYNLCMRLYKTCESMHRLLVDHIDREEIELWPLFRECFTVNEQEGIVGNILGRTNAEVLQDMLPWVMGSLTQEEQHTMMMLWRQVTRNTMFDEWLREWWEGYDAPRPVSADLNEDAIDKKDPLEVVFEYLASKGGEENEEKMGGIESCVANNIETVDSYSNYLDVFQYKNVEYMESCEKDEKKRVPEVQNDIVSWAKPDHRAFSETAQKSNHRDLLMKMSQEDLDAAIRRVSRDSSIDTQKKSYIIQNLIVSRWIVRHHSQSTISNNSEEEFSGREASYRDNLKQSFGCKHYKRNCKLVAPCCNQLYTCLKCHDEMTPDHVIDRKCVSEMMCMQCLKIQPIGPTCTTPSCNGFSMAKYYCRICKIFDDRVIYHCPYCNLCRLGKGLGIDYFHCMNCNACMSRSLFVHICREKCIMDNCPICNEDMFTSTLAVKALQCGHLMHSKCFEAYTCTNYTCPICGKSLGDMQVYFKMLDALLAEEKIPDEYANQKQAILCNDCGKRGETRFHWMYHKCSLCGSYNTRVL